jgi:hypothetical protein
MTGENIVAEFETASNQVSALVNEVFDRIKDGKIFMLGQAERDIFGSEGKNMDIEQRVAVLYEKVSDPRKVPMTKAMKDMKMALDGVKDGSLICYEQAFSSVSNNLSEMVRKRFTQITHWEEKLEDYVQQVLDAEGSGMTIDEAAITRDGTKVTYDFSHVSERILRIETRLKSMESLVGKMGMRYFQDRTLNDILGIKMVMKGKKTPNIYFHQMARSGHQEIFDKIDYIINNLQETTNVPSEAAVRLTSFLRFYLSSSKDMGNFGPAALMSANLESLKGRFLESLKGKEAGQLFSVLQDVYQTVFEDYTKLERLRTKQMKISDLLGSRHAQASEKNLGDNIDACYLFALNFMTQEAEQIINLNTSNYRLKLPELHGFNVEVAAQNYIQKGKMISARIMKVTSDERKKLANLSGRRFDEHLSACLKAETKAAETFYKHLGFHPFRIKEGTFTAQLATNYGDQNNQDHIKLLDRNIIVDFMSGYNFAELIKDCQEISNIILAKERPTVRAEKDSRRPYTLKEVQESIDSVEKLTISTKGTELSGWFVENKNPSEKLDKVHPNLIERNPAVDDFPGKDYIYNPKYGTFRQLKFKVAGGLEIQIETPLMEFNGRTGEDEHEEYKLRGRTGMHKSINKAFGKHAQLAKQFYVQLRDSVRTHFKDVINDKYLALQEESYDQKDMDDLLALFDRFKSQYYEIDSSRGEERYKKAFGDDMGLERALTKRSMADYEELTARITNLPQFCINTGNYSQESLEKAKEIRKYLSSKGFICLDDQELEGVVSAYQLESRLDYFGALLADKPQDEPIDRDHDGQIRRLIASGLINYILSEKANIPGTVLPESFGRELERLGKDFNSYAEAEEGFMLHERLTSKHVEKLSRRETVVHKYISTIFKDDKELLSGVSGAVNLIFERLAHKEE